MRATEIECYYDKRFDQQKVDRIEEITAEWLPEWIEQTEEALRLHLSKHRDQMSAATVEGFTLISSDDEAFCLRALLVYRSDPNPIQCQIYAGHEDFIMGIRDSIKNQWTQELQRPGRNGFVVERDAIK